MRQRSVIIPGQRFGRLIIIREIEEQPPFRIILCRCDCGVEIPVRLNSLRTGNTTSCGCFRKEVVSAKNLTHGMSQTSIYQTWKGMIKRCENPNDSVYRYYGGRGIKVCTRWRESFDAFLKDVGIPPENQTSIDRIDNERGYEPGNVRWVNRMMQPRNRRSNRNITIDGMTHCLSEWCEIYDAPYATVGRRIREHGMTPIEALTTPFHRD